MQSNISKFHQEAEEEEKKQEEEEQGPKTPNAAMALQQKHFKFLGVFTDIY